MSKVGSIGPAVREGRGGRNKITSVQSKIHSSSCWFKEMQNLIDQLHCVFETVYISTLGSSLQSKKKKKFTSLNPIMCFLYCAWMNFSQIRNWNSKWDRWETLGPSETKSRPRQSWLQQSCFSTQPTKYDQKKKGGGGGKKSPPKPILIYSNCTFWNLTKAAV